MTSGISLVVRSPVLGAKRPLVIPPFLEVELYWVSEALQEKEQLFLEHFLRLAI